MPNLKRADASRESTGAESIGAHFAWRESSFFGISYVAAISNGVVMTVVLLALLAWSLSGPVQAIMLMTLAGLVKFTNRAVTTMPSYATALFWVIALAASARLFLSARRVSLPFLLVVAFSLAAILLSVIASKAVDVSVLKVISFFIMSSAMLLAAESLTAEQTLRLQRFLFSAMVVMAALSLLTVPFPKVAFQVTPGLFQGLFSHPQAAGVFFVPFAAWFIARIFLQQLRAVPWWVIAMAVFLSGMIVATGSRTAMLATFVSVALTMTIVLAKGQTGPTGRSRGQVIGFASVMLAISIAVLASGVLQEEMESVAFKDEDAGSVEDAMQQSRGMMVASHIENFLDAPLTGHGFGVYREGVGGGGTRIKRFMGLPVSASTEKGVVFTSVLEEVGIFGGLLFYALLISIVARAAQGGNPSALAMVIGAIMVNIGEAIIFSINGMGLFMWVVIGFGLARARLGAELSGAAARDASSPKPRPVALRAR